MEAIENSKYVFDSLLAYADRHSDIDISDEKDRKWEKILIDQRNATIDRTNLEFEKLGLGTRCKIITDEDGEDDMVFILSNTDYSKFNDHSFLYKFIITMYIEGDTIFEPTTKQSSTEFVNGIFRKYSIPLILVKEKHKIMLYKLGPKLINENDAHRFCC